MTPGRAQELAENMLEQGGGKPFHCHKTVDYSGEEPAVTDKALHCAGALVFAEKQGKQTQIMQVASRIGLYDPAALMADPVVVAGVFDDADQMVEACRNYK